MARRQSLLKQVAEKAKASGETSSTSPAPGADRLLQSRQNLMSDIAAGRRRDTAQLLVEPSRCKMWRRHNRIYKHLNSENCGDLIERIGAEGQKIPAIVRRIDGDDEYEFEVIAGARRHFAVSYLRDVEGREDMFYLVEVRTLSDQDAFTLSDLENRSRKDISDYERGLDYESALAEFYDGNVKSMADQIGMKRQTLTHYLNVARLPQEILGAYGDPAQIAVRHASFLTPLLSKVGTKEAILSEAGAISAIQKNSLELGAGWALDGSTVFKRLQDAGVASKPTRAKPSRSVVTDSEGREVLSAERGRKYLTLRVPVDRLEEKKVIIDAVKKSL